jgi:hypothetical protein
LSGNYRWQIADWRFTNDVLPVFALGIKEGKFLLSGCLRLAELAKKSPLSHKFLLSF